MDKKMMFLVPGMVLGAVVAVAGPQAPAENNNTEVRVNVGRQQVLFASGEEMRKANEKAVAGDYDGAIAGYRKVISMLKDFQGGEVFRTRIANCQKRVAECYQQKADAAIRRADKKLTSNDFEDAIKICTEAIGYCPERRDELQKKIEYYTIRRDAALARENAGIAKLDPEHSLQQYEIQLLLEQGRTLASRNQLVQARRKFEEILLIDPFNAEATQNLEGINNRIRKDARIRANATARRMTGKVEWDGVVPIVRDATIGTPENQLGTPVQKKADAKSGLETRLKAIKIPRFDVKDRRETFETLMAQLQRLTRNADPDKNGVNFIVRREDAGEGKEKMLPAYSFNNKSVYDILQTLKLAKVLDFKVSETAVFVAPPGVELEEMQVKHFPYALKKNDTAKSLKSAFEAHGIDFREGAEVSLVRSRNHVVVRNTSENLKKVNEVLERMRDAEPMVQVMFKFIEVSQSDLDELGFNWAYSRFDTEYGDHTGSFNTNELLRHYDPSDAADRFAGLSTGGTGYEYYSPVKEQWTQVRDDKGELQWATDAQGNPKTDANGNKIPLMENKLTTPQWDKDATVQGMWYDRRNLLSLSVYALDWADSSDILYSPRVTTISGTTAEIDMTEKHWYPDTWETIDTESNNDFRIEVPIPQPELSLEANLGVKFKVTPQADKKTGLIQVPIDIPITQFAGWMVVDTRPAPSASGESDDDDGEYIKKPIFTERSIKTIVTVKDGETVLIGGVTQDLSKSIDDKVPILGDIPFIGRFFQSKYMNSQKNHLLVFMTCRMVKPDGAPINPEKKEHGLPQFPRNM